MSLADVKQKLLNGEMKDYSEAELSRILRMVNHAKTKATHYDKDWAEKEAARELAEKKAYDLKGWDWISLSNEQVAEMAMLIGDQFDSHDYSLKHVALRKVALRYRTEIWYYTVVSANMLHIKVWDDWEEAQCWDCEIDVKILPRELKLLNQNRIDEDTLDFLKQENKTVGDRTISNYEEFALLFLIINEFLLHYKDVAFNVREIMCKGPSVKKEYRDSTAETRVVRLMKQYKLKKNWVAAVKRRKAEIRCAAWGVRGHFRHYKNGTVIFVQPYVKGKDREQYKGKVYELLPKEERSRAQ